MHDLPAVIKRCGIAVIAAVVAACTAVPVSQDYALDYDFANVASYAWLTPDNEQREPAYDALMHERYRDAIEAQMALVLSGAFLGLLPEHAARAHVETGKLRRLPFSGPNLDVPMSLVTRNAPRPATIELFRKEMLALYPDD